MLDDARRLNGQPSLLVPKLVVWVHRRERENSHHNNPIALNHWLKFAIVIFVAVQLLACGLPGQNGMIVRRNATVATKHAHANVISPNQLVEAHLAKDQQHKVAAAIIKHVPIILVAKAKY